MIPAEGVEDVRRNDLENFMLIQIKKLQPLKVAAFIDKNGGDAGNTEEAVSC